MLNVLAFVPGPWVRQWEGLDNGNEGYSSEMYLGNFQRKEFLNSFLVEVTLPILHLPSTP